MSTALLLAENLFSIGQFPAHLVVGNEEPVGSEAYRVADGRRSVTDFWTPITANNDAYLRVTFDRIRSFDTLVLDRGHNLAGYTVRVRASNDGFSTVQTLANTVTPSVVHPGDLNGTFGVRTEEGAWAIRFPAIAAAAADVFIPAMGANLKPVIVGAWLGLSYDPGFLFNPWSEDGAALAGTETTTPWRWRGRSDLAPNHRGVLHLRFEDEFSYDYARYHVGLFRAGKPTWLFYDQAAAERGFLGVCPLETPIEPGYRQGWFPRQLDLPYEGYNEARL